MATEASAQQAPCTPNPAAVTLRPELFFGAAGFAPNPLPEATVGQAYDQVIQFKALKQLTDPIPLTITAVKVIGFTGQQVPNAYNWVNYQVVSSNPADVTTGVDTIVVTPQGDTISGCIRLTGTPTCKTEAGKDTILLKIQVVPQGLPQSVVDNALGPGVRLKFAVNGAASDPTCQATSIAEAIQRTFDVSILPTRTTGNVTVNYTLPVYSRVKAEVYSADGKLVYTTTDDATAGLNTMEIPSQNFAPGLYIVRMHVGGTTTSK
ncbi:MAG: T9SS type A sorting domain-containing protein, partial [Bacteroidia bacterium]|nr:T9SS type A sorting domain-containing protein [Bacteroidia bacterium]